MSLLYWGERHCLPKDCLETPCFWLVAILSGNWMLERGCCVDQVIHFAYHEKHRQLIRQIVFSPTQNCSIIKIVHISFCLSGALKAHYSSPLSVGGHDQNWMLPDNKNLFPFIRRVSWAFLAPVFLRVDNSILSVFFVCIATALGYSFALSRRSLPHWPHCIFWLLIGLISVPLSVCATAHPQRTNALNLPLHPFAAVTFEVYQSGFLTKWRREKEKNAREILDHP